MTLVSQDLGVLLATLADAIEGGNSWRGSGTVLQGIPGQYPNNEDLPMTITATGGSTTTVEDSTRSWPADTWATENAAPFFLLGLAGANAGAHRKITDWSLVEPNTGSSDKLKIDSGGGGLGIGDTVNVTATGEGSPGEKNGLTVTIYGATSGYVTVALSAFGTGIYSGLLVTALPVAIDGAAATANWLINRPKFTVAAFASAVSQSNTFSLLQGFRRVPNWEDIDSDAGVADGFDRHFHLAATPGKRAQWAGSGALTYQTELKLRLRIAKRGRIHDWTAATLTNLGILRCALPNTANYDSTYIRALVAGESDPKTVKEDSRKLVVEDTYRLFYRLDAATA